MKIELFLIALGCLAFVSSTKGERSISESHDYISRECNNKLKQIDSIAKFEEFLDHYKFLIKNHEKPKKSLLSSEKHLRRCYDDEESILEMETLVKLRKQGICRMDYIEQLVEFHYKYLASNEDRKNVDVGLESNSNSKTTYIKHFFSLFAHQVAYTCKSRISSNLRSVQSKLDCSIVLAQAVPQIFSRKQDQISSDDDETFQHISNFLDHFERVENFVPILKLNKVKVPQGYYEVILADEAVARIENLKKECRLREPYYMAIFSPVSALAQINYNIDDVHSLDLDNVEKRVLKCWLAMAQLCQGIVRINMTSEKNNSDPELKVKLISIRWGSSVVDDYTEETQTSLDLDGSSFDEISPFIKEEVRKKSTTSAKIKSTISSMVDNFIKKHIDLNALQNEAEKRLINTLSEEVKGIDSKVAFSGRQMDEKKFNPTSIVVNSTDKFVTYFGSFFGKKVHIVFSCVVGVVMSAVFVWFSLYALAKVARQHYFAPEDTGNFKSDYLDLRQKQINAIKDRKTGFFKLYKAN